MFVLLLFFFCCCCLCFRIICLGRAVFLVFCPWFLVGLCWVPRVALTQGALATGDRNVPSLSLSPAIYWSYHAILVPFPSVLAYTCLPPLDMRTRAFWPACTIAFRLLDSLALSNARSSLARPKLRPPCPETPPPTTLTPGARERHPVQHPKRGKSVRADDWSKESVCASLPARAVYQ